MKTKILKYFIKRYRNKVLYLEDLQYKVNEKTEKEKYLKLEFKSWIYYYKQKLLELKLRKVEKQL